MNQIVDFLQGDIVKVSNHDLKIMKQIASRNDRNRYRLCLHDSPENRLHDMLICRKRNIYMRPDKHDGIPESHTIIEGSEAIVLFSDGGEVRDAFLLDREQGYLCYRINADVYHMTIPLTEYAIDYEVKLGPFLPSCNIFPSWAPARENSEEARKFLQDVYVKIQDLLPSG